jgi:hypothetical protein
MREKSQDDIIIPDATGPIAVGVPSGFPITVALFVPELVEYQGNGGELERQGTDYGDLEVVATAGRCARHDERSLDR